jgi:hypothetical protein
VATISWFVFEKPLNGLKEYFPYADRRPERQPATGRALDHGLIS